MPPSFSVDGLSVIVTGAAQGNGAAIAKGFAEAGARVAAVDKQPFEVDAFAASIIADLSEPEAGRSVVHQVLAEAGKVDVLVNNAGISLAGEDPYSDEIWQNTFSVNVEACLRLIRECAAHMAEEGGGSIINITSLGAMRGFPGNPSYQASKAALRQLTLAVARDFGGSNVRANNICPGYIHTAMTDKSFNDPELHQDRLSHMLLPRWGQSSDLVGAALFLASPAASYITGIDLPVDGGWLAKGL